METAVESYNPDGLLLSRFRHDGLATHRAARCILPVRDNRSSLVEIRDASLFCGRANVCIPMKVVYAVYLRCGVHSEGHPVQAAVTNHTRETARMVGFSHGPQDAVQNGLGAL